MNCSSTPPAPSIVSDCRNDIDLNNETIKLSMNLSGNERKAIKLLSKQFHIESIRREAPETNDEGIQVVQMPLIITYCNPNEPEEKFEWLIKNY